MTRRWTAGLLILLMLVSAAGAEDTLRGYDAGEGYIYVAMGQYPQTAEGEVRPILWRVLAVNDGEAVLLSEYILFARCMNADLKAYRDVLKGDFAQTDLCAYLNGTFMADAFSDSKSELADNTIDSTSLLSSGANGWLCFDGAVHGGDNPAHAASGAWTS